VTTSFLDFEPILTALPTEKEEPLYKGLDLTFEEQDYIHRILKLLFLNKSFKYFVLVRFVLLDIQDFF
jgi:hypothetical protein